MENLSVEKKVYTVEEVTAMLNGNVTAETVASLKSILAEKQAAQAKALREEARLAAEEAIRVENEKAAREYAEKVGTEFVNITLLLQSTVKEAAAKLALKGDKKLTPEQVVEEWNAFTASIGTILGSMPKAPTAAKAKVTAEKSTSGGGAKKVGGVIDVILTTVTNAGAAGILKADVLEVLEATFPERDAEKMKTTLNAQLPSKLRLAGHKVEKTDDGHYFIAAE